MAESIKFNEKFINDLINLAGGLITPDKFDRLVEKLETEASRYFFTDSTESNLLRILNALYDKRSFLSEAADYPHHLEILMAVAANSNYLTDIIVRNPEYLYQLFDNEYLEKKSTRNDLDTELVQGVKRYKTTEAKVNFVRLFKRRYLLKIGLKDILGYDDLAETTRSLSVLANAVCAVVFEISFNEVKQKYGVEFIANSYTLCSLGKLGGMELNYSSDVDFILFYEKNETENGTEYHEVLTSAVKQFVYHCMEKTDKGFLYRVDFRLRPDGKNSPLCKAYSDYLRYYESRGEDWERQMLIKSGFTGGSRELYAKFTGLITSFIYPSSFTESPVNRIRQMKTKIEKRSGDDNNIKLFAGGIRDIEFSVQALQLINGGKIKELRTGTSLIAIKVLNEHGLLSDREAMVYRDAYIFYRKVEHYLQLMNDTQTHIIPDKSELTEKMAVYLGFENEDMFNQYLENLRGEVRKIYVSVMEEEETVSEVITIDDISFEDHNKAAKNLRYLHTGSGLLGNKNFDSRTIELFKKIFPVLKDALAKTDYPDDMLDNFSRIISAASFPSIWYSEFLNEAFFRECLRIFSLSQKSADLLVSDKKLGEVFISRKMFTKNPAAHIKEFTLEGLLFTLSVQFTAGLINYSEVSEALSSFISAKMQEIVKNIIPDYEYALIGLGSFATGGMTFESDADLIVIVRNLEEHNTAHSDFQKFLAEAKEKLRPFEVDFRLRPEGKTSPLVWDIEAYRRYLQNRARIWEFQAFSKLKLVAGSPVLFNEFKNAVTDNFPRFGKDEILREVKSMHSAITSGGIGAFTKSVNLKKDKGALVTIDFALHSLIMSDPEIYKSTLGKTFTEKAVIAKNHFNVDFSGMVDNYTFLKTAELAVQVLFNKSKPDVPSEKLKLNKFIYFMEAISYGDAVSTLSRVISENKKEFDKITG